MYGQRDENKASPRAREARDRCARWTRWEEARTLARVGTGLAALLLLGAAGNLALLIIL